MSDDRKLKFDVTKGREQTAAYQERQRAREQRESRDHFDECLCSLGVVRWPCYDCAMDMAEGYPDLW